ncbi:MAG: phosphohistidine phosphatase SixA [Deltaproteobacteria bacterium]|nr:phosphohistidine phosphatase SixA [Deltaproteobacteria bacterium]
MRQIFFLRHGQAEPNNVLGDAERNLTETGRKQAKAAAMAMKKLRIRPGKVFFSPFNRANQTAEIVADAMRIKELEEDEALIPAGYADVVADLIFKSNDKNLLVVSHLPLLPHVAAHLLGGPVQINLNPGSMMHLTIMGGQGSHGSAALTGLWDASLLQHLAR